MGLFAIEYRIPYLTSALKSDAAVIWAPVAMDLSDTNTSRATRSEMPSLNFGRSSTIPRGSSTVRASDPMISVFFEWRSTQTTPAKDMKNCETKEQIENIATQKPDEVYKVMYQTMTKATICEPKRVMA